MRAKTSATVVVLEIMHWLYTASERFVIECLILLTLLLALALHGLGADLFVILLKCSKVLTALGELSLLHTLTDVPVNECALGVHKIELVVNASEDLGNGGSVGDHTACTLNLGKITTWDDGWWLVVDTTLEAGWAPVDELDGTLGLDGGNGGVHVLRDNVSTVHHAASHVFTVARIALGHHVGWLEARVGDLGNRECLVVGLLSRDDWRVGRNHEVNTWVWHQVGLELSDVNVEGTVESEGSGQGGDHLGDETVQVGVGWALDVETATADIIDSLVVKHDGNIGVLEERVGGEHGVVWLNNGGGHLRGWVHTESELGLLAVIDREALEEEGSETGAGATTNSVEDHEALETGTLVGELTEAVKSKVNNLLANGVVATSVVIGCVLLARDQLLWVVELTVGAGTDLVNHGWLKIEVDGAWDVLASASLREEGVERIVTTSDGLVGRHLAIRLDAVLEAVKLPASVTGLATALADVDGDTFAHIW